MATQRVILTYKDYEALPDDGRRHEIYDGELAVTPAPSPQHQLATRNLFRPLDAHVVTHRLGEVLFAPIDVILSDTNIIQPDLVYLANDRLSQISSRGIEGPPTLVVQTLSPSTAQSDRRTKLQLCARHSVPYYWIVDPDARAIEAYVLREGAYSLAVRATGSDPVLLPPFNDLPIRLDPIWP